MIKSCVFDKASGEGGELHYIEDLKTSEFCMEGRFGWVAVFSESAVHCTALPIPEKK